MTPAFRNLYSGAVMTPGFHGLLRAEQTGWRAGRPLWRTLEPLRYDSAILGATVVIPAEFITDLASVPRLPLTWLVAGARATRAAVVHDYAYQTGTLVLADGTVREVARSEADAIFREAMASDPLDGTGVVSRGVMWAAVRVGGRSSWQGKTERAHDLNPIWSDEGWPTEVQAA